MWVIFLGKKNSNNCENVTILVYICKAFRDVLDLHVAEAAFNLKCEIEYTAICNILTVNKCKIITFKYNGNRGT